MHVLHVSGATSESELKAGHALEVRASSGSGNEVKSQSQYDEWVLSDDEWKEVAMVHFILNYVLLSQTILCFIFVLGSKQWLNQDQSSIKQTTSSHFKFYQNMNISSYPLFIFNPSSIMLLFFCH